MSIDYGINLEALRAELGKRNEAHKLAVDSRLVDQIIGNINSNLPTFYETVQKLMGIEDMPYIVRNRAILKAKNRVLESARMMMNLPERLGNSVTIPNAEKEMILVLLEACMDEYLSSGKVYIPNGS